MMYMLLITFHIAVAVITTAASVGAIASIVRQKKTQRALRVMWSSFGATALTGIGLVVMQPHLLAHTCVMMSLYVVVTGSIQYFAARQTVTA